MELAVCPFVTEGTLHKQSLLALIKLVFLSQAHIRQNKMMNEMSLSYITVQIVPKLTHK